MLAPAEVTRAPGNGATPLSSVGVTLHAALQNKNVVCSGSRVTNSTVMKLHESDNRGGIAVKTCTKSTCSHFYCLLAFRSLPSYLCDCFQLYTPSRTLRSASNTLSPQQIPSTRFHTPSPRQDDVRDAKTGPLF